LGIIPTGENGNITNWDVAVALNQHHTDTHGRRLDPNIPADYNILLQDIAVNYDEQMLSDANGLDWYTADIKEAIETTKQFIPELKYKVNRDLLLAFTAITSPLTPAITNWGNGVLIMEGYTKDGRVPLTNEDGNAFGVPGIRSGLEMLQMLIDQYTQEGAVEWLTTPHTAMEIAKFRQDSGLFSKTIEHKDGTFTDRKTWDYHPKEMRKSDRPLGIYMMGPKIGDFFMNASGFDNQTVTVDRWLVKTWNRLTGRLMDVSDANREHLELKADVRGRGERDQIKRLITDLAGLKNVDPSAAQAAMWFFEQRLYTSYGSKAESGTFSQGARQAAQARNVAIPGTAENVQGVGADAVRIIDEGKKFSYGRHRENFYEIEEENYADMRGKSMTIWLDQQSDYATLFIKSNKKTIQVRGDPRIGSAATGDRLYRLVDAIPKQVNISALFAGEKRGVPAKWNDSIIDALEFEDEMQRRFQSDTSPKKSIGARTEPRPEDGMYDQLIGADKKIWTSAGKWLRKQFAPGGLLHEWAFDAKIKRDSEFRAAEYEIDFLTTELNRAIRVSFGKRWSALSDGHKQQINDLLRGSPTSTLPGPIKKAVFAMRQFLDNGSGTYAQILLKQADAALAEAEETGNREKIKEASSRRNLIKIISDNIGEWVHRSYRVFDDPNWHKKISRPVYDTAMNYLMSTGNYATEEAANVFISDLVKGEKTAFESMEAMIREGTLGAKDMTALMKRNNIAPEIRALMGEYDDARVNFAKSAVKITHLIFNQEFLDKILEVGEGEFLFKNETAEATHKLTGEHSEILSPLNGWWVTPETKQAFKDALGKSEAPNWLRKIFALNAVIKVGKTLYSPITQMRNFQSAYMFTVANGHFDLTHMRQAFKSMKGYIGSLEGGEREYHRERIRDGVLHNNPHAGVLMDLLKDSRESQIIEEVFFSEGGSIKEKIQGAGKIIQKLYVAGDDFWKIVGFENELAMVMKAKGWTRAEATPMVAERIRDTYPT
jgi:hypothetical protein